jgi:hypothetical protein
MLQKLTTAIREVFTNGAPVQQPVTFVWRSISRKGRPCLLLPDAGQDVRTDLGLYSAQRRRAKIASALLPVLFKSPAKIWFERIQLEADAATEIMQFLAQQSGVPANRLQTPAVKFGGVGQQSRIVLLLCDETNRPVKVVKVGINPAGRAATDREADLLKKLPPDKLGCVRASGRISTATVSAFATDFFPGVSPTNDAGLEHLFHSWFNSDAPQPIETLATWQEMADKVAVADPGAWQIISAALAGKTVRTTLFHGDFAPWNIRAVNATNLQIFDWERGHLKGIPAWDWFHFTVQTSILARRLSVERVAAEVELLLHSRRFKDYAETAGIGDLARPLLLAYLQYQKCVIKPIEGGATTAKLYEFLAAHWQVKPPSASVASPLPTAEPAPAGPWVAARRQLHAAAAQVINLFWEPSLHFQSEQSLPAQILIYWPVILLTMLLMVAVAAAQYIAGTHLMFLSFYLAICVVTTWKTNRRLGSLAALVAAFAGPLVAGFKDAGYAQFDVFLWNTVMRFIILEMGVLFTNRIHEQEHILRHGGKPDRPPLKISDVWAILLASGLLLAIIGWFDWITNPDLTFLPMYLFPCMIITLISNLRWGVAAALIATAIGADVEYYTNGHYTVAQSFGWNFVMRFLLFLIFVLLLDRLRRKNILFYPPPHK